MATAALSLMPSQNSPRPGSQQRPASTTTPAMSSTVAAALAQTSSNRPRKMIGDYILGKTLGAGSMGKVKVGVHNKTGRKVAVKIIPRNPPPGSEEGKSGAVVDTDNKEVRVVREAAILQLLRHPNVVKMYDMVVHPRYFYLFFEYVSGGQMLDYIIGHGRLKEKVARKFVRQMVSAIDYCHRNSVVHRDLKIENILITETGRIKLIDFGLANLFSPRSLLKTFCGSLYFAAPELLNARPYVGPEVDVWSLGVVLYVLVCGKVPFDDQSMPVLHAKIKRGVVEYPDFLSDDCKHLLSRMLVVNSAERATIREIRHHRWLNKNYAKPISARMPYREPLELPLDPNVIQRMTGFQFGSVREITVQLEDVVAAWTERRRLASEMKWRFHLEESANKGSTPPTVPALTVGAPNQANASAGKRPVPEYQDDDTPLETEEERDPLVSIYYLCREKLERETLGIDEQDLEFEDLETAEETMGARGTTSITRKELFKEQVNRMRGKEVMIDPVASVNKTQQAAPTQQQRYRRAKSEQSPPHTSQSGKRESLISRIGRAMRGGPRVFETESYFEEKRAIRSSPIDSETRRKKADADVNRRQSLRPSPGGGRRVKANGTSTLPGTKFDRFPSAEDHTIETAMVERRPSTRDDDDFPQNNVSLRKRISGFWKGLKRGGSMEDKSRMPPVPQKRASENSVKPEGPNDQIANNTILSDDDMEEFDPTNRQSAPASSAQNMSSQNGGDFQSIPPKYKTVYLTGLFSVSTTSSLSPSEICSLLRKAMRQSNVHFRESGRGRFDCKWIWAKSGDARTAAGPAGEESLVMGMETGSLNDQKADLGIPGEVWFECSVVKIPWLFGIHGVRFRRIAGDL